MTEIVHGDAVMPARWRVCEVVPDDGSPVCVGVSVWDAESEQLTLAFPLDAAARLGRALLAKAERLALPGVP